MARILNGHPLQGQGQPPVVLSQPFNDIQLVAMVAAHLNDRTSAESRVALAQDIVAEAVARSGEMQNKILAAQQRARKAQDAT